MKNKVYKDFLYGMSHSLISVFGNVLLCQLFIRLLLFISPTNFMCNMSASITFFSIIIPFFIEYGYIICQTSAREEYEKVKGLGAFVGILISQVLTVIFFSLII